MRQVKSCGVTMDFTGTLAVDSPDLLVDRIEELGDWSLQVDLDSARR